MPVDALAPSGITAVSGSIGKTTVTITIGVPGVVSWTAHGLLAGAAVTFTTTSALPTGIVSGTIYYVSSLGLATNSFEISSTYANALAGTSITTSGTQSGTQSGISLQTATLIPIPGRSFNITIAGTFVGSIQLEWYINSTILWAPITASGIQLYIWTAPASESAENDQFGAQFRLNCTAYTSGTINYIISQ